MTDEGMKNLCAAILRKAGEDWNLVKDSGYAVVEGHRRLYRAEVKSFWRSDYAEWMAECARMRQFPVWREEVLRYEVQTPSL